MDEAYVIPNRDLAAGEYCMYRPCVFFEDRGECVTSGQNYNDATMRSVMNQGVVHIIVG